MVLFTGDGGFWYHLSELETAVRWNAPVVALVNNNGALNQGMDAAAHGDTWKFADADFVAIARAMGADGVRVDRASELKGALDTALATARETRKPFVVDVVSDITAQAPEAYVGEGGG